MQVIVTLNDFIYIKHAFRRSIISQVYKCTISSRRYHYGEDHPSLGLFYVKMAKANLSLKLFKEGMHLIDLAKQILKISMGPEHPFLLREVADIESLAKEDLDYKFELRQRDLEKNGGTTKGNVDYNDAEFWRREKAFKNRADDKPECFGVEGYSVYY